MRFFVFLDSRVWSRAADPLVGYTQASASRRLTQLSQGLALSHLSLSNLVSFSYWTSSSTADTYFLRLHGVHDSCGRPRMGALDGRTPPLDCNSMI